MKNWGGCACDYDDNDLIFFIYIYIYYMNQVGEFAVYKQADREALVNFSFILGASMVAIYGLKRKFF